MRRSRILGIALTVVTTGLLNGGATAVADAAWAEPAPAAASPLAAIPAAAPAALALAPRALAAPALAAPAAAAPAAAAAAAALAAPAPAVTPAAPAAPAKQTGGVPCASSVRACIDLSHNRAWLLRGGVVQYGPVPITSGRAGYRTPSGTFHVLSRERLHLSREFDDAPMPYSVFFYPGDAFHQGSLAVPSHGCVHLSRAAAITFFNSLRVGDVVQAVR